jgi:hypothetical protein
LVIYAETKGFDSVIVNFESKREMQSQRILLTDLVQTLSTIIGLILPLFVTDSYFVMDRHIWHCKICIDHAPLATWLLPYTRFNHVILSFIWLLVIMVISIMKYFNNN